MSKGLGLWPHQDQLHESQRGSTVYVLNLSALSAETMWMPLTARFLVCPDCGKRYQDEADTLSGHAMEWMPGPEGEGYVLWCLCGKMFPQHNWFAGIEEATGGAKP